jgi:hypothetical protein
MMEQSETRSERELSEEPTSSYDEEAEMRSGYGEDGGQLLFIEALGAYEVEC